MPMPSAELVQGLADKADILVSFPPDGSTDAILAPACSSARCIIYISSTGVYGRTRGQIDDSTPADYSDERMRSRLEAESIWKEHGAIVLRVPGIYGPNSGLHKRLRQGKFKIPGDGSNLISRIHVEDLAAIILAIFEEGKLNDSTYLVGDQAPCSIREVVDWLCQKMELQLPESIPIEEVNATLRGSRSIDATRLLNELGLTLRFPDYKSGYEQCLSEESQ